MRMRPGDGAAVVAGTVPSYFILFLEQFPHGRADHVIGRASRHFWHDDLHYFPHIGRRGRAGFM